MARIRTIKPEFFTSLDIVRHDLLTRLVYVGLWTHCDDYGRCAYDPRLVKAALFPLDDDITPEDLRKSLESLHDASQVLIYDHHGRAYLQVTAWEEHQRVSHPGKDKLPAYDDPDSVLRQSSGDSPESLRPEQGTGNREQGTPTESTRTAPKADPFEHFDEFWALYPRKVNKKEARSRWKNMTKTNRANAVGALPAHVKDWKRKNTEMDLIPYPTTWLNRDSWEFDLGGEASVSNFVESDGARIAGNAL